MALDHFSFLQNVGKFENVSAGAKLTFKQLALIYAENGRGKTTLANILRSISTGDAGPISDRKRLGAKQGPHIVLTVAGAPSIFKNGAWAAPLPQVAVFDDVFVAENVCAGIEIASAHRQNLHELILGAQGVALNATLQNHIDRVEEHNVALRAKQNDIPAASRGSFTVDAFCSIPIDNNIKEKIQAAERSLSAARSADTIRQRAAFMPLALPSFDVEGINALLERTLSSIETEAAANVRQHLRKLQKGGEAWVSEGMQRVASVSDGLKHEICPFCAQDLAGSSLIQHYQAYFSAAYQDLKSKISEVGVRINEQHAGENPAAFERAIRVASENAKFWREFVDIPELNIDTAEIARSWIAARDAILTALRAKAAAPLEAATLPPEVLAAVDTYDAHRTNIGSLSERLISTNTAIAIVKERAATANVAALSSDMLKLQIIEKRHNPTTDALCAKYLAEKGLKTATEKLRDAARTALEEYRGTIFPAYEKAINEYLQRFGAGFRLGSVTSVNNRTGSSVTYNFLIDNVAVFLTADEGPAFRNTLSAGDRNTLALAFFFASLDQDPQLGKKIVVIDDPMTSLDEHRSLTTVQEMRSLGARVAQVIALSHSKPFLCALWEGADTLARSAIRIERDGTGSTLEAWDVRQDCITEHDRRHERVSEYVKNGSFKMERIVAADLRPILEGFMRVAYPTVFPPGTMLGHFHNTCSQRIGATNEILSAKDTGELRALLDYANKFHHDTNAAWETVTVNGQELTTFSQRTLAFTRRG